MATDTSTILDKISSIKNDSETETLLGGKGALMTGLIGAGIGLLVGYSRKYNLLLSAVIGGAAGGLIGKYFINKKSNA